MHIILLKLNNILKQQLLNVCHVSHNKHGAHNYINRLFNVTVSCMWQNCRKFLNVQYTCDNIINNNNNNNNNNNVTAVHQIYYNS